MAKFNIETLGMRKVRATETRQVFVQKEGFAGKVAVTKTEEVLVDELQCDLTLKEAKALEKACGKQLWAFEPNKDRYLCVVTPERGNKRRFMITKEIYSELRPMEAEAPVE